MVRSDTVPAGLCCTFSLESCGLESLQNLPVRRHWRAAEAPARIRPPRGRRRADRTQSRSRTGPLRVFCDPAHTEDCHVNARKHGECPSYEADAVTLDGYLAGRGEKFVVKIDCQGAEMLVFDGMGRVMDSGPAIVAELVPEITEDMGRDWVGFFEERAGDYLLVAMEEGGPAYEVPPGALNLLRGWPARDAKQVVRRADGAAPADLWADMGLDRARRRPGVKAAPEIGGPRPALIRRQNLQSAEPA